MSSALFFSVGTIGLSTRGGRKPSTLLQAARHNQRAQQNERGARSHIDPALSHRNERLSGPDTPEKVAALAQTLMAGAGVAVDKLRKDYTQAVELLFSLPPDTTINTGDYFRACVAWAGERFGAGNILSADIHRDEAAPHLHVLVLPLVGGRMNGSALKSRPELAKLRESFWQEVARRFGLKKPRTGMTGQLRGDAFAAVLAKLEATSDPALRSPLWQTIRRDIERNPAPYIEALGAEVAERKRKTKSFAKIMTGKGRSTAEDRQRGALVAPTKAIAFEPQNDRKLSSGSFRPSGPSSSPTQTARDAGPVVDAGGHEVASLDRLEQAPATQPPETGGAAREVWPSGSEPAQSGGAGDLEGQSGAHRPDAETGRRWGKVGKRCVPFELGPDLQWMADALAAIPPGKRRQRAPRTERAARDVAETWAAAVMATSGKPEHDTHAASHEPADVEGTGQVRDGDHADGQWPTEGATEARDSALQLAERIIAARRAKRSRMAAGQGNAA